MGALGDFFDGGAFVTFLGEDGKGCGFKLCAGGEAAGLARRGWEIFRDKETRARESGSRHGYGLTGAGMAPPMSAPAQQQSIQPPNAPAISGAMLGKAMGKKALEKGSSRRVGRASETAPGSH